MNFIYSLFNKFNLNYVVFVFENLTFSIILCIIYVFASQFAETDQYPGSFEDLPSQTLSMYYNQILNANFSTFYLLGFFQHKKQSLLIESCHLYAYIINPMCKKKKKMYNSFGFVLGFGGAGIFFIFCFSFCAQTFHNSSKAGTLGLGLGGSFWNVNLGLLKKVRTASDKFITRLNLIMSCSSALSSEPFPPSPLFRCSPFLPRLCFSVSSTQAYRLKHPPVFSREL